MTTSNNINSFNMPIISTSNSQASTASTVTPLFAGFRFSSPPVSASSVPTSNSQASTASTVTPLFAGFRFSSPPVSASSVQTSNSQASTASTVTPLFAGFRFSSPPVSASSVPTSNSQASTASTVTPLFAGFRFSSPPVSASSVPTSNSQLGIITNQRNRAIINVRRGTSSPFAQRNRQNNSEIEEFKILQIVNKDGLFVDKDKKEILVTSSNQVSKNPIKIISYLSKILNRHSIELLPTTLRYIDSDGIDEGGLMRSFVTDLVEKFCNSKDSLVIKTNEGVIPTTKFNSDLSLLEKKNCFKTIGRFFSAALQEDRSIVLGQNFHPIVFEILFSLTEEDFTKDDIEEIFDKMLSIWLLKKNNANEDFITNIIKDNITNTMKEDLGIDLEEQYSKEQYIKDEEIDQIFEAIFTLGKSMYACIDSDYYEWNLLKGDSAKTLREKIQGSISSDLVKNAIEINESSETKVNKNTLEYLDKWVNDSSPKMLEQFIYAISGLKTLTSDLKLNVAGVNNVDIFPEFHTCTFTIDLPEYSNYEVFKEKLELGLASCFEDTGFQKA